MDSIAFEMGAVFLLAGLLMFGSAHGLIPRSLRNIGAPILIGVALVGFLIWRFGPDLYANLRSNAAPWFATAEPATSEPAAVGPSSATSASPAPHQAKPAVPAVQGIVIRDVVSAPEPAPPVIVAGPVEDAAAKPAEQSSDGSVYDSGVKRAAKSVGRFLHIGGKKKDQPPQ